MEDNESSSSSVISENYNEFPPSPQSVVSAEEESDEDDADVPTYDMHVTATHSYLGKDLEEVRGNALYDDNAILDIPMMIQNFVMLQPGQLMPLVVRNRPTMEMLRNCRKENRSVFGVVNSSNYQLTERVAEHGVTAEILEYKDEGNHMYVKARGRQRFELRGITTKKSLPYGKVKIMPETRPRRGFDDSRVTVLDRHRTPTLDSATEDQRRFKVERFDAAVTPWPAWVLNSVDPFYLSTKIEKQLRDIQLIRATRIPDTPNELSYWLCQNFPLFDAVRDKLLAQNHATSRLYYYTQFFQKKRVIDCKTCSVTLAKCSNMIQMSPEGLQSIYANPSGFIFEAVTLSKVTSNVYAELTSPSSDCSWFPGYSWISVNCKRCYRHLGWKFVAQEENLKPETFWALRGKEVTLTSHDDATSDPSNL